MPDWNEIDINEILNFDGAHTGQMARYERIMRQKEIEAMGNMHAGLFDLKKSIHHASDNLNERIKEFIKSQGKLQKITIALTIVIALATVTYTWVTWQTVQAQKEANTIQRELLKL